MLKKSLFFIMFFNLVVSTYAQSTTNTTPSTEYSNADQSIRVKIFSPVIRETGNLFHSSKKEFIHASISYDGGYKYFDTYTELNYAYRGIVGEVAEKCNRYLTYRKGDYYLKINEPLGQNYILIYTNITRPNQEIKLYKVIINKEYHWYD